MATTISRSMYKSCPDLNYQDTLFDTPIKGVYRSWYHENIQNNNTLLIVAGDSWTWGDSLYGIDAPNGIVDDDRRTTGIYGHLLSQKLNSDFVNIARCGSNNAEIIPRLKKVLDYNWNRYQSITVLITLTETGREFLIYPKWWLKPAPSLTALLEHFELLLVEQFNQLFESFPDVNFYIARNFTYSFDSTKTMLKCTHVPKSWVDCLAEYQGLNNYPQDVRFVSMMVYNPLEETLRRTLQLSTHKKEFFSLLKTAETCNNWLVNSKLNYKKASKHPTELGHKIWADYLYDIMHRWQSGPMQRIANP